jgi:hypothetical protein
MSAQMPSGPLGSLAVIQVSSVGSGYRLVNFCTEPLKALELIPLTKGALCLVLGPTSHLLTLIRAQRSATLIASEIIESADPRVLNAFYNLNTDSICEILITIEAREMGRLFSIAQEALALGLNILEFRPPRAGQDRGLLSLTLKSEDQNLSSAQDFWVNQLILDRTLDVERISPIFDPLKSLFPSALS